MRKKLVSLLLIFSFCIIQSGCHMPQRVDFPELLVRMKRDQGDIIPGMEESFFSDDEWFLFLDSCSESDTLLRAQEGENHLLVKASLCIINTGESGQSEKFVSLCDSLIFAFAGEDNGGELLDGIKLKKENIVFSEEVCFFEKGRYGLSFFNDPMGSSFIIELLY